MSLYRSLLRSVLFALSDDPETAHHLVLLALRGTSRSRGLLRAIDRTLAVHDDRLAQTVFGVAFPNPVGLAGGFAKNAEGLHALAALGFGHIEAGTILPEPQPGNPRPRIWRIPKEKTIVNAMGFNSSGQKRFRARLMRHARCPVPLGINVSRNKTTPNADAHNDFTTCIRELRGLSDWFTVNVSSPNTPGLRDLQDAASLRQLSERCVAAAEGTPVLLKLSPDLADDMIIDACEIAVEVGMRGIVATNTTLRRDPLTLFPEAKNPGGMSGPHLHGRALQVVRLCAKTLNGRLPIIGVGGVADVYRTLHMFEAGASLVQLYTGFIYEGPALPGRINADLALELTTRRLNNIAALQESLRRGE